MTRSMIVLRAKRRRCWGLVLAALLLTVALCLALDRGASLVLQTAANLSALLADPRTALARVRTPGAGEEVLPHEARAMLALLRDQAVPEFRYAGWPPGAGNVPDDLSTLVEQRVTEGAYPIRRSTTSPFWISPSSLLIPATCRIIATREEAVLARCP
jgi:hypothetical protein